MATRSARNSNQISSKLYVTVIIKNRRKAFWITQSKIIFKRFTAQHNIRGLNKDLLVKRFYGHPNMDIHRSDIQQLSLTNSVCTWVCCLVNLSNTTMLCMIESGKFKQAQSNEFHTISAVGWRETGSDHSSNGFDHTLNCSELIQDQTTKQTAIITLTPRTITHLLLL